ncbi:MAG: phosphoglycerate kinase, partial [Clostridia bacterium]|nr:phosphoglycerate kinase [Clostridia bacterium]
MQYNKKSVKDIDVKGKKVLVRCDFNVPQDGNGAITNDKRIREALPTIRYLLEQGAAVILCSHLGKPKGERKMKYTLTPVAKHLSDMLGVPVKMCFDTVGKEATRLCGEIKPGEVVMLENLRFDAGEEAGSELFAEHLAALADIYVNDAFGAAHRKHASTAMISKYLPAVCGLLMEKEISVMGKAMAEPEHPFVAIMGGSKVSDKLGLIGSFVGKCDAILVVGGMAYTFFKAMGGTIGSSICDDKSLGLVKGIIEDAESKGTKIYLPVDTVIADQFS